MEFQSGLPITRAEQRERLSKSRELAIQELERLKLLGFRPWEMDSNQVFSKKLLTIEKVSFPTDAWSNLDPEIENSSYWSEHRVAAIAKFLAHYPGTVLWEIGAGNGNVCNNLNKLGFPTLAIEPLYDGAKAIAKSGNQVFNATLNLLNLPNNSIAAFGAFDVIEHLEKPIELLKDLNLKLNDGGLLLITVPAHNWLYSDYDEAIGHYRRYSRKTITDELEAAGFVDVTVTNLFGFLVLPAYFLRRLPYLMGRRRDKNKVNENTQKVSKFARILDPIIRTILRIENLLHPLFGLSLLVTAKKSS